MSICRMLFPKILLVLTLVLIGVLTYEGTLAQTSQSNCLNLDQILILLQKQVPQDNIIEQVQRYHVQFKLDSSSTEKLRSAGARENLLDAINMNYYALPPIIPIIPIIFSDWSPYGEIEINVSTDDQNSFVATGTPNSYPGFTTNSPFRIGDRRTLVIRVNGSGNCVFSNQRRMLKIIAGSKQRPLYCNDNKFISAAITNS